VLVAVHSDPLPEHGGGKTRAGPVRTSAGLVDGAEGFVDVASLGRVAASPERVAAHHYLTTRVTEPVNVSGPVMVTE
jgi:hypothetical protein